MTILSTMNEPSNVIVIGASAGGLEPLMQLVSALPADIKAAICVAMHIAPHRKSLLPDLLNRTGKLKAAHPVDAEPLLEGRIYVAPPNRHMRISSSKVYLDHGPLENSFRPAIDTLFRSAAVSMDGKVIGLILSGALDDGTAGLIAIKSLGGLAIVQEPSETAFSGMPESAISKVDVDYVLPIQNISEKLVELCRERSSSSSAVPQIDLDEFNEATLSGFICPECGGPLSESNRTEPPLFVCRVGHRMSTEALSGAQAAGVEKALWTAVRALSEQAELSRRLAKRFKNREKLSNAAERYERKAYTAEKEAEIVRSVIMKLYKPSTKVKK